MRACISFLILLGGCDASASELDAGRSSDGAVIEGDFAVLVEHDGVALEDGDALSVEFGCQGGAHVEVDVRAMADGAMRDATARVEVEGGPLPVDTTLVMEETSSGAEVLTITAPFGDLFSSFLSPSSFAFPVAATLRATVTARDGSAVTVERPIALVMGGTCTCTYNGAIPGTARIDAFTVTGEGTGCEPVQVGLDVTVTLDDPMMHLFNEVPTHHDFDWPAQCVDALGLAIGGDLRLGVRDSYPGQPCDPGSVLEGPSRDSFACDCPVP